jgi:site-specific DNA recombinase
MRHASHPRSVLGSDARSNGKEEPVTRVCIYTRISTDEENQPTSLHSQRERLEAFCKVQESWHVSAHHEDRATGTSLDRPGLKEALELARAKAIDVLLVYRVDRLSRKVRQLSQLAEELDRLGVVLRSATEPFDTGSAAGRMMLQMLAVFAEFEHATIVDRITAGIERRAKQGHWPNGRVPFGYRRDGEKRLVPDERSAPTVRRIFDLYAKGRLGTAAIARRLHAEHAPAPPRGWRPAIVLQIISNEAYIGRVNWRGQTFAGLHEPLVDEDTFTRARALLSERGEDLAARRSNTSDFLLSGLIRCGRCRRAYVGMSAKGNGGTYRYYACSGRQKLGRKGCDGERLGREKLEAAVLSQLSKLYRDGELIGQAIERTSAQRGQERVGLAERSTVLAKEIKQAERALERYHDAFEASKLGAGRFAERVQALDARLDALREQERQLARELASEAPTAPDADDLAAVAGHLDQIIAAGDPKQSKALLRLLIAELRVNSASEILPTYRVVDPSVCAPTSSVESTWIEPVTSGHDAHPFFSGGGASSPTSAPPAAAATVSSSEELCEIANAIATPNTAARISTARLFHRSPIASPTAPATRLTPCLSCSLPGLGFGARMPMIAPAIPLPLAQY